MVKDSERRYLIIAGAYRAGTTTLFRSLAAHPEVVAARIKEPGYFATPELTPEGTYPLCGSTDFSSYAGLFAAGEGLHVEATAFYLFDSKAARRILDELPQSKILIVLRDPVRRMASWYQLLSLLRLLPPRTTFDDYVRTQLDDHRHVDDRPLIMRCLQHGCYRSYVENYRALFGDERMLVLLFDDVIQDSTATLRKLAIFAGVDPEFYETYMPGRENPARALRRDAYYDYYAFVIELAKRAVRHSGRATTLLERTRAAIEPRLFQLMTLVAEPVPISAETNALLRSYYAADTAALAELLQVAIPWATRTSP